MSTLLLTNKEDISADLVVLELRSRGEHFVRLNVEDAPSIRVENDPRSGQWLWTLADGRKISAEGGFRSVWYRRPGWVGDGVLASDVADFTNNQWRQCLWSLTNSSNVLWINDPYCNMRAECKPIQLSVAHSLGLTVPDTRVTNNTSCLREFRASHKNGVIVKALYAPLLEADQSFIFTHLLNESEVPAEAEMCIAPLICQEALFPKKDLRVTIVGEHLYAAELELDPSQSIDWRLSSHEGNWRVTALPELLQQQLFAFVRRLGLVFAGIDLIFYNEQYYFIEVNPNGEWGWLQTQAGLPIARAIAQTLIAEKR